MTGVQTCALPICKPWLVKNGSALALWAVEKKLPFAEKVVKATVFEQFVGGTTLLDSQPSIDKLAQFNTLTVLDYGAEAKDTELDFNHTMNENIQMAKNNGFKTCEVLFRWANFATFIAIK